MKRCTECALLFENRQTHCPQCGRLLVKSKKGPRFFIVTILSVLLALIGGLILSFFTVAL